MEINKTMRLIIDTKQNTIEIDGKNIKATYDVHGEIDFVLSRKIECVENTENDEYKESPAQVGKLFLSINPIYLGENTIMF